MSSLPLEVVALALQRKSDGCYLLAKRSLGSSGAGQWEFPGGKIELGETQTDALVREIQEELSIVIRAQDLHFVASHEFQYPLKKIRLHLWTAIVTDTPLVQLTEHDEITWRRPLEMMDLGISGADIYFINKLL